MEKWNLISKLVATVLVFVMIFNSTLAIANDVVYYAEKEEYEEVEEEIEIEIYVYEEKVVYDDYYYEEEEEELIAEVEIIEVAEEVIPLELPLPALDLGVSVITRYTSGASTDAEFLEMVVRNILYVGDYDPLSLVVPGSIRLHRGSIEQIGVFEVPQTMDFPIQNGIVLTPARAEHVFSPSDDWDNPYRIEGEGYEPLTLLAVESGGLPQTNAAVVLEFQLMTQGNHISFEYLFSSREFDQAPSFNDVFALWVVDNYDEEILHNIALLPEPTSLPVTINNVRTTPHTEPGPYFVPVFDNNINGYPFPYLGHTILLTANTEGILGSNEAPLVQNGVPVTLRLAIANVGDNNLPSVVFINGNSLIVHEPDEEDEEDDELPFYFPPVDVPTYIPTPQIQPTIEAQSPPPPYIPLPANFKASVQGMSLDRNTYHSSHNNKNSRVSVQTPAKIIKLRTYLNRGYITNLEFLILRNQIFLEESTYENY